MAERKQDQKTMPKPKATVAEKPKSIFEGRFKPAPAANLAKTADRKEKVPAKKKGKIAVWWQETLGELRKVSWPTIPEARRMTVIVLAVMGATALFFGVLDWIFSQFVGLIIRL